MGRSTAWLTATAVAASLPVNSDALREPRSWPVSASRLTTRRQDAGAVGAPMMMTTTTSILTRVPRGGELVHDDDTEKEDVVVNENGHDEQQEPTSSQDNAGLDNKKKKRRRKKQTNKKEHEDDTTTPSSVAKDNNDGGSSKDTNQAQATNNNPPASSSAPAPSPKQKQQPQPQTTLPIVEEILKEDDYYRILKITRAEVQQNPAIIKKSYRRRALQTHPDKTNGDRRAFDKVAEAYEILSDDEKRQVYNRHGKKGLHGAGPGVGGFPTAEDLFRSFFGGGGGGPGPGRGSPFAPPRRNRSVRYQLEVTLEDLYQGLSRTVAVASPEVPRGYSGGTFQKQVQVNIPRGALSGQSIRLSGAMDFDPDDTPGDLIFSLQQRPHRRFNRKGHDLALAMNISLDEAIHGVTRTIRHLDGRTLTVGSAREYGNNKNRTNSNNVPPLARAIQTGDVHVLKGQGMPKDAQGTEFGDLYIQYQVDLPATTGVAANRLTPEEREQLAKLIRKMEGRAEPVSSTEYQRDLQYLKPAQVSDFGVASGRAEIPRDDMDDHHHHHDDGYTNPFSSPYGRGSSFYWSSGIGGPSPFFGMNPEDLFRGPGPEDGNEQCRQM